MSNETNNQGDSKLTEHSCDISGRGNYIRGRCFNSGGRGRFGSSGRSSHFSNMKCYNCGHLGHPAYRCFDKASSSQGDKKVSYVQKEISSSTSPEISLDSESGENLMFRRVLIK